MRMPALVGVAAGAAVAGGVVALALGTAVGLTGDETTVVTPPLASQTVAAPTTATPLVGREFRPAEIYAARAPGVVTIYAEFDDGAVTQGSGFVVDARGSILTNAHVVTDVAEVDETEPVSNADEVFVEFRDGERVPATIVGRDLFNDIGVVHVDPAIHPLTPVPLGESDRVVVGTPVAAIGSPFGKQSSLAVGVVSAIGRTIDSLTSEFAIADAIQIDAPINRGNSGGPLFDAQGRVIGINAQIQSTSGSAEGVGFAIPIDLVRVALREILKTGKVEYAYVGIQSQDVTPGMARALALPATAGALVARVEPGTPAALAGLRAGSSVRRYNGADVTVGGDVVVAIAGRKVSSADDIGRIVGRTLRPGQTVTFIVARGSGRTSLEVTLGTRPSQRG